MTKSVLCVLELPSYMLLEINIARVLFLQLQVQPCKRGPWQALQSLP